MGKTKTYSRKYNKKSRTKKWKTSKYNKSVNGVTYRKKKQWGASPSVGSNYYYNSSSAYSDTFALSDLTGDLPHFQALYDQYKITGIKATFFPQVVVNETATGAGASDRMVVPTLVYAVDYDDDDTSFDSDSLLLRNDAKVRLFNKPVSVYFKPKPLMSVNTAEDGSQSANVASLGSKQSQWLSCADAKNVGITVPHFGLKHIVSNGGAVPQGTTYQVLFTYYLAFRSMK